MGEAMGKGLVRHLERLGLPPVSHVVSSPLTRCLQTAAAAAIALGIREIAVEPGLAEGMLEDWYRSWAVPGADSTWGGPAHARVGTPLPSDAVLHAAANAPAGTLLHTPAAAASMLADKGVSAVGIDTTYEPIAPPARYRWGEFETEEGLADRMEATMRALAARFPGQSVLACSHGGPCEHAHRRLTAGQSTGGPAGYTALYVFIYDEDGSDAWRAPLAADTTHLDAMRS